MADAYLTALLDRPIAAPDPQARRAVEAGPIAPVDALAIADLDRLLDPAPVAAETGWCTLPDGVGYVAARTPMPGVTAAMVDWWFDWHARDPLRYRVWHPLAHISNSIDPPPVPGGRPHWGAVHHPVEDVGTGVVHARISFLRPTDYGFSTDALDRPFPEAARRIVLEPVGMASSTFEQPLASRLEQRAVMPHDIAGAPQPRSYNPHAVGQGDAGELPDRDYQGRRPGGGHRSARRSGCRPRTVSPCSPGNCRQTGCPREGYR